MCRVLAFRFCKMHAFISQTVYVMMVLFVLSNLQTVSRTNRRFSANNLAEIDGFKIEATAEPKCRINNEFMQKKKENRGTRKCFEFLSR